MVNLGFQLAQMCSACCGTAQPEVMVIKVLPAALPHQLTWP